MKPIISLFLSFCICFQALAQGVVTVSAVGASGSYKTGYVLNTTTPARYDDGITVNYQSASTSTVGDARGWAVFNLAGVVPTGATITGVRIRYKIIGIAGSGTASTAIYGYNGDMSTITSPATIYANCMLGAPLCTTFFGSTIGTYNPALNTAGETFIAAAASAGSTITLSFLATSNPSQTFFIFGHGGTGATDQPQLQISYVCPGVSGITATATPTTLCEGSTFTLSGAGTGATNYRWSGPSGFSTTALNPTNVFTASATTAGVYTLTAYSSSGCTTHSLVTVTSNPMPSPITGAPVVCISSTTNLTESMTGGTWSITPTSIATINSSGTVTGVTGGTAIVTYTSPAGCYVTYPIGVGAADTIRGMPFACIGQRTRLTNSVAGGTWSSANVLIASVTAVDANSADLIGGSLSGTTTITYSTGCGSPVTMSVTAVQPPPPITGAGTICQATTLTLADTARGGRWSSAATSIATVNPTSGVVTGTGGGAAIITYTDTRGCYDTALVTVNPLPATITGTLQACPGTTTTLRNAVTGGRWLTTSSIATVDSITGVLTGISAGSLIVTYYNSCGYITTSVVVNAAPPAITGDTNACINATSTLYNAIPGGFWRSNDTTIALAAAGLGTYTGVRAGVTTITYTALTSCVATIRVNIIALPAPITGTLQLCPGFSTYLSDATTGGRWFSADTTIAKIDSVTGLVRARVASTTTITYTSRLTGCSRTTSFLVNPEPDFITGPTTFCARDIDTLRNATTGGTWTSSNASQAAIDPASGGLTTATAGTPTITYTLPTGCYKTRRLLIHPLPNPTITYDGGLNTLSVPTYYLSYQWYKNSVLIPGANAYRIAGVDVGNYHVYVRDTFSCKDSSTIYTVTNTMLGTEDVDASKISVYPIPAKQVVNIASPIPVNATLRNIIGKVAAHKNNATFINVEGLPKGIYFLELTNMTGDKIATKKLIIE